MTKDYLIAALAQAIGIAFAGTVTIVISPLARSLGKGRVPVLSGLVQLLAMFGQAGFLAGAIQMGSRERPLGRLFRYAQIRPDRDRHAGLGGARPAAATPARCARSSACLGVHSRHRLAAGPPCESNARGATACTAAAQHLQQTLYRPAARLGALLTVASAINPTSASALAGLLVSAIVALGQHVAAQAARSTVPHGRSWTWGN